MTLGRSPKKRGTNPQETTQRTTGTKNTGQEEAGTAPKATDTGTDAHHQEPQRRTTTNDETQENEPAGSNQAARRANEPAAERDEKNATTHQPTQLASPLPSDMGSGVSPGNRPRKQQLLAAILRLLCDIPTKRVLGKRSDRTPPWGRKGESNKTAKRQLKIRRSQSVNLKTDLHKKIDHP